MKRHHKLLMVSLLMIMVSPSLIFAQDDIKDNEFNPVNTGVTTLGIAPDARGSAMGNLGAATDPDINSQYWNPSKYAFAYSSGGIGLSYTPWLRKLVNDIFLADLTGYWKLGSGDNQAISASLRYFSLGEVTMNDDTGATLQTINPYEMAFDIGYSRKLSESFSMGVALRYILSDLSYEDSYSGEQTTAASAFAADLAGYYVSYPMVGRNECQFAFGFNINNIGSKVSYNHGANNAFLPTNLRLGASFMFPLADYNTLALGLDLNKLLVPTKPRQRDFDMDTTEGQAAYEEALDEWENMSPITGIFKSFGDAPGGFKEELQEINLSIGAEYAYNQQFFARMGYYYENANKGGRSYFGFGAGFSLNVVRLDASYMLATAQSSPLDQTLRFTLSFDMDGLKDLVGARR
ncbi:MAG: type IX secretion system outer membrane channel protein PorV [Muribaculaceae bacterium]|nr:type IX secretion system outer membrane channel protein PorV [Muribaculaceae bacterium]MBQ1185649.1 type IX secretion system outer membrane channel protein PorV [Muribaculaceae bacterium]MBR5787082.1 type IX secretion system outer membrane channel protein PorV [Muribaculaceae bacterium]MEE1366299.1 type IX secretion system outer membrane channel protein PorV [Muribaculaceae bacterium]